MRSEPFDVEGLTGAHVFLVGYAGRDQAAVRAHVEELARHGVPAPSEVPAVWPVPTALLSQRAEVVVDGPGTSGEAEPVLLLADSRAWLTVGSDHTDRELERTSMDDAKRACNKVLARERWALADAAPRWDEIVLRSWIAVGGTWEPYQEAPLAALLPPDWYLARFRDEGDAVVFCGTVPTVGDLVTDAAAFRAELHDTASGATLRCEYEIVGRGPDPGEKD